MSEIDSNLDNEEFGKDTYIFLRQQKLFRGRIRKRSNW